MNIFFIDDDTFLLNTLKVSLKSAKNFSFYFFTEGQKAIAKAENIKPNLVFLDINMPKMSGYLFSSLVDKNDNFKNTKIILMTGESQLVGNYINITIPKKIDKIKKPFMLSEVINKIDTYTSTASG